MTVCQLTDSRWRKSAYSSTPEGACVELHPKGAVRDSKNPDGPQLAVSLSAFMSAVKSGHLTR